MDNFIPDNASEEEEYVIVGRELTPLIVQPAFVESIEPEKRSFDSIPEAFRFIFRNNREYGIISWNGIPVRFSYTEDLPEMIGPLAVLLENLKSGSASARFRTPDFELEWYAELRYNGQLLLRQNCRRITGNYEKALNDLGMIPLNYSGFRNEWKLLIEQLAEAFKRSEASLNKPSDRLTLANLFALGKKIRGKGSLYNY